ncbi:proline-rich protein 23C-like [Callospermophilus lateralis]|uniref:proline-rich protein 23C-like n=1 Tax=Callospermophilus lateralis TaxID=76772 RepID=UPI0040539CB3
MVGIRPRSPSACPAPCGGPQPGGPGPAKRRRLDDPADPAEPPAAPTLQDSAGAADSNALTSVVVLATGCALHVPLDDVDLVLEPAPTSVLQVNLQGHNLILIPEGLVRATSQRPGSQGDCPEDPELGAFLRPLGENVVIEQKFFCEFMPEIIRQIEAVKEDALEEEFLEQWMDPPAGPQGPIPYLPAWAPTPSPVRRSSNPAYDVDFHLLRPFPTSPLQPLPPSPSSSPQAPPQRSPRPRSKACRCLF